MWDADGQGLPEAWPVTFGDWRVPAGAVPCTSWGDARGEDPDVVLARRTKPARSPDSRGGPHAADFRPLQPPHGPRDQGSPLEGAWGRRTNHGARGAVAHWQA